MPAAARPMLHNDLFDCLFIAQATLQGLTLLPADAVLAQCPGPILKA